MFYLLFGYFDAIFDGRSAFIHGHFRRDDFGSKSQRCVASSTSDESDGNQLLSSITIGGHEESTSPVHDHVSRQVLDKYFELMGRGETRFLVLNPQRWGRKALPRRRSPCRIM